MNDNYLTVDIGNTRCKWSFFDKLGKVLDSGVYDNIHEETLNTWEHLCTFEPKAVLFSNVGEPDIAFVSWLKNNFKNCFELTHETEMPFLNQYATPKTLGKDRLAGVAGAWYLFTNHNCLVIDAGTCIKYDFITAEGCYLGGGISPGIEMRFQALQRFTARLPLIEKKLENFSFIGDSTETAITSGVQWGVINEIEGFIAQYEAVYDNIQLILTGGDAPFLKRHLKNTIFAAPNLVQVGLFSILNHNYIAHNEFYNKS